MSQSRALFEEAIARVSALPSGAVSDDDKLHLYGLYKRVVCGEATGGRPPLWKPQARAKWDAWKEVEGLGVEDAMQGYVVAVQALVPCWRPSSSTTTTTTTPSTVESHSREGNEEGEREEETARHHQQAPPKRLSTGGDAAVTRPSDDHYPRPTKRALRRRAPCRPFGANIEKLSSRAPWRVFPRKRLDISMADLGSALLSCGWRREGARSQLEEDIARLWVSPSSIGADERHTMTCLCVRTGWDLLLTALRLEEGCEVVMTAVTIPDMVRITRRHGLVPVPVDIDPVTLAPSLQDVQRAITPKTRVLCLTHLYGAVITPLSPFVALARERGLVVVEDCAQAFSPTHFRGDAEADVSLFSFGTIKTATALGGAVLRFRDATLCARVRRLEAALPLQTSQQVASKAAKVLLLHMLSTPAACGLLCAALGSLYDSMVTRACRSFRAPTPAAFLAAIRRRPSVAVLALMRRRLQCLSDPSQHHGDAAYVQARVETAKAAIQLLREVQGIALIGADAALHTHWLLPVQVVQEGADPAAVASKLRRAGYDATTGTTQLGTVVEHMGHGSKSGEEVTPRAQEMMRKVLYLPVSPEMSTEALLGLRSALQDALRACTSHTSKDTGKRWGAWGALGDGRIPFALGLLVLSLCMRWLGPVLSVLFLLVLAALAVALMRLLVSPQKTSPLLRHCRPLSDEEKVTRLRELDSLYPCPPSVDPASSSSSSRAAPPSSDQPAGAVVLLTGATGFVGQMVCSTLLRHASSLSDRSDSGVSLLGSGVRVDKIILLIRSKGGRSAETRWSEMRHLEILSSFPTALLDRVVTVAAGDVSLPGCGLTEEDRSRVLRGVTNVIHVAASVKFDMPLAEAASTNIGGALRVQALAKSLPSCRRLVHVSTAFVHPSSSSSSASLPETLVGLGGFDAGSLYQSMLGTQWLAGQARKRLGFANDYVLTKCVAEHLLAQSRGSLDLAIVRPPIVGPSWCSPRPGWSGTKPSTLTACLCLRLKGLIRFFPCPDLAAALIPVDVTAHIIVSSALQHQQPRQEESGGARLQIRHAAWHVPSLTWFRVSTLYYEYALLRRPQAEGGSGRLVPIFYLRLLRLLPRLPRSAYLLLHSLLNVLPLRIYNALSPLPPMIVRAATNLPKSYEPFMNHPFRFVSGLRPPPSFNADAYLLHALMQSEKFVNKPPSSHPPTPPTDKWVQAVGPPSSPMGLMSPWMELLYCLCRPCGSVILRLTAWLTGMSLSRCLSGIFVDLPSMAAIQATLEDHQGKGDGDAAAPTPIVVLLPTHRSYLDFIVLSWLRFRYPEMMGHVMPRIAAAIDAFDPCLAWLMTSWLGAFFVRRRAVDPGLQASVQEHVGGRSLPSSSSSSCCNNAPVVEVFLEGTRSRDRRLGKARTGVLRCLLREAAHRPLLLVPLTLNYDLIPEQAALASELQQGGTAATPSRASGRGWGQDVWGLIRWARDVWGGRISLGSVFVAAGEPLWVEAGTNEDEVKSLAARVQVEQKRRVVVTSAHVRAAADDWNLSTSSITVAMNELGVEVVANVGQEVALPVDPTQRWMLHCQWLGHAAGLIAKDRPDWGAWLAGGGAAGHGEVEERSSSVGAELQAVLSCVTRCLDEVEQAVTSTVDILRAQGYSEPSPAHVQQYTRHQDAAAASSSSSSSTMPVQLVKAVLARTVADSDEGDEMGGETGEVLWDRLEASTAAAAAAGGTSAPAGAYHINRGEESIEEVEEEEAYGAWGFRDSRFVVDGGGDAVVMEGQRYPLSGRRLSGLLPFFERELGVCIYPEQTWLSWPCPVPASLSGGVKLPATVRERLQRILPGDRQVSVSPRDRCRHGTGHALEDMMRLRTGQVGRMPDVVVWPESEEQVLALVSLAKEEETGLCLIPFGGGTNVSLALQCPSGEERVVVSVDMRRMGKVLWVNEEDGLAEVQAGMVGRRLQKELADRGLTMGHEPDSIEFSTLGGWIATRASGMKRTRYGNIEDIVVGVRVATARAGLAWQGPSMSKCSNQSEMAQQGSHRRASHGVDLKNLMLGSEGMLGIITSAVVRVWPLPPCNVYDSAVLPSMEVGLRVMREMARLPPSLRPASIRLVDNAQFRLGRVLHKGLKTGAAGGGTVTALAAAVVRPIVEAGQALLLSRSGFRREDVAAVSMLFEGSEDEVLLQQTRVRAIIAKAGGMRSGSANGRAGYELTFSVGYIRDFALTYHVAGESFESFVSWSRLEETLDAVRERVMREHQHARLEGRPFLSSRVTQVYEEGACVYWYLAVCVRGASDPAGVFRRLESVAREEVLQRGGSVSHHHGIGKARTRLLREWALSPAAVDVMGDVKRGLDPHNVFAAGNGVMVIEPTPQQPGTTVEQSDTDKLSYPEAAAPHDSVAGEATVAAAAVATQQRSSWLSPSDEKWTKDSELEKKGVVAAGPEVEEKRVVTSRILNE